MSEEVQGNLSHGPAENRKPLKNDDNVDVQGNLSHDLPEWLLEVKENLVGERVPEHQDASSSSRELLSEPRAKVVSRKHSIFNSHPEGPKLRQSAWEPRLQGLLAENALVQSCQERKNFGDLITADHEVLSEGCESRHNHRYAVVVEDLATQWIQSYPCKTKTSQETEKSLQKFLEPTRKPKVIYIDNSLEFGKYCEDLSWNHRTSTPHRSETIGIAERAVRRMKEGTSAVLLQSGLDEKWWAHSMVCETVKTSCLMGRHFVRGGFGVPFDGPVISFGSLVEYHPISAKDQSRLHQFGPGWYSLDIHGVLYLSAKHSRSLVWWETLYEWRFGEPFMDHLSRLVQWLSITLILRKTSQESINLERKSCLDCSLDTLCTRGESGKETSWSQTLRNWKRWTHLESMQKDSMQRKC